MDKLADSLGIASAGSAMLRGVAKLFCDLSDNPERSQRLVIMADALMDKLKYLSAESASYPAIVPMLEQFQRQRRTLESIRKRHTEHAGPRERILSFFTASAEQEELVGIEGTMKSLLDVTIVKAEGTSLKSLLDEAEALGNSLLLQLRPTIVNDSIELPLSKVGLDRGQAVLDFLQGTQSQDFRVIVIHGLPGLGKTTLLNYVWKKAALKPTYRSAYVQIGLRTDATAPAETICKLQSDILRQLGDQHMKEFPSIDMGRGELKKHFEKLKDEKRPLFLAIDNVFKAEDLEWLLPLKLGSENLATSSCIAVTCRNFNIVETLLSICHLQVRDREHVFCLEPPCLNLEDSKKVFSESAGMVHSAPEHQDLLNALVPLCGGLPLALTVLGKMFVNEARREREEWQRVEKQWAALDDDDDDEVSSRVTSALELSFNMLRPSRQIAFLDMVSTFYGWNWERVERIVGVNVMRDLKNSSLVWKVESNSKCNQSALRHGHGNFDTHFQQFDYSREAISMHDLTLQVGEKLIRKNTLGYKQFVKAPALTNIPEASTLRNFQLLSGGGNHESVLNFLQSATNLQMLHLRCYGFEKQIVYASSCKKTDQCVQQLRNLLLFGCASSRSIMEMKVTREIREIILYGCKDIEELPNTALQLLQRLDIHSCEKFQGFSASCVQQWGCLRELRLSGLPQVTRIPTELGDLPSLKSISVHVCPHLEEFPSLRNPHGPSRLLLSDCNALKALGAMSCPLQILCLSSLPIQMFELAAVTSLRDVRVTYCSNLVKLPATIFNASLLESLLIAGCASLDVELPLDEEIGCGMTSLTDLKISNCRGLKRLPAGIFQKASSLQKLVLGKWKTGLVRLPAEIGTLNMLIKLDLHKCEELVELPEQIEGLRSLKVLSLTNCAKLKKLPESIFCNMPALEHLDLCGCASLEKLPEQMEGLCSLKELTLGECSNLQRLPDSIYSITSLEVLELGGKSLVQLPEQIGGLTSLRSLTLRSYEKLEKLPDCIGNMSSLEKLNLHSCESLVKLPDQIGGLTSLRYLMLDGFEKLEKLLDCIGNLSSLETLDLRSCESLVELPEHIQGLTSLRELDLRGCKKLEKLPDCIGNLSSLEELNLRSCENLVKLPEHIQGLTSLRELVLTGCKKLEKLPDCIGNLSSLKELRLMWCESLVELPEHIQGLTSLRYLDLRGCKKLEKLPDCIFGKMSSLQYLDVTGCESLADAPRSSEGLTVWKIGGNERRSF